MKYATVVHFIDDLDAVAVIRPAHREYLSELITSGQLAASGPFDDLTGAMFIYEAGSQAEAEQLADADPYTVGGVIRERSITAWRMIYADIPPISQL